MFRVVTGLASILMMFMFSPMPSALARTDCTGCGGYVSPGPSEESACYNVTAYLTTIDPGACIWNGSTSECQTGAPCTFIFQIKVESKVSPPPETCDIDDVVGIGLLNGAFVTQVNFANGLVHQDTRDIRCDRDYVLVIKEGSTEIFQIAFVCSSCSATTLPPF